MGTGTAESEAVSNKKIPTTLTAQESVAVAHLLLLKLIPPRRSNPSNRQPLIRLRRQESILGRRQIARPVIQ